MNVFSIPRGYQKHIGSRAWLEPLVLGGAGALAGYGLGGLAARVALAKMPHLRRLVGEVSPAERELAIRDIKRVSAAFGGSVGAIYALHKHWMGREKGAPKRIEEAKKERESRTYVPPRERGFWWQPRTYVPKPFESGR